MRSRESRSCLAPARYGPLLLTTVAFRDCTAPTCSSLPGQTFSALRPGRCPRTCPSAASKREFRDREPVLRERPIHADRFKNHRRHGITVAQTLNHTRPYNAIGLGISREDRDVLDTVLGNRIAAVVGLADRQPSGLTETDRGHAVFGVGDIHQIRRLVLALIGAAVLDDQARVVQPVAQNVEYVARQLFAEVRDFLLTERSRASPRDLVAPGLIEHHAV